ncbi:MAG: hypothetical protein IJO64_02705 [Clostridia bacterium]|nr:hypothetical protein [Clostridia bacterium]
MDELKSLELKINRARYNLMFMLILSLVNIYFVISSGKIFVPFSSSISVYATLFGATLKNETSASMPFVLGIVIAGIALGAFLICYFKSKTSPFFMFLAFTLLAADFIVLLFISFVNGSFTQWFNILDIILHALVLFYLFGGIKAHSKMARLKSKQAEDAAFQEEEEEEETSEDDNCKPEKEDIYKYCDDGTEPLVTGQAAGLSVFAVIRDNVAELVINDYVCDELDVSDYDEFTLRAIVNDTDFMFEYKKTPNGDMMFLYADDELLDSFGRQ